MYVSRKHEAEPLTGMMHRGLAVDCEYKTPEKGREEEIPPRNRNDLLCIPTYVVQSRTRAYTILFV